MLDLSTIQDPYKKRPVNSPEAAFNRWLAADKRGRTAGGRFTTNFFEHVEGDDFAPDSLFWTRQAKASLRHLGELLDPLGINSQVGGLMWPGETINNLTWRTIRDMAEAVITAFEEGERDPENLAEAAHRKLESLLS